MAKFFGFSTTNSVTPPFTLYDAELYRQDLTNQFYTRKGERIMNPNFGTIIFDLLFEPNDEFTQEKIIQDAIRIVKSDPRGLYVSSRVQFFDQGIILQIQLKYTPTNVIDTLELQYLREVESEFN